MTDENRLKKLAIRVSLLRMAFGVIWGIDALFKWSPTFQRTYLAQVVAAAQGQPAWLAWLFRAGEAIIRLDQQFFALFTAVTESIIAVILIVGLARRIGYVAGFVFSLMVWGLAEGFGGPYTAGSTDIGTGIIYAVVFAALYGLDRAVGVSPWSLDARLGRRIRGWDRVSEPSSVDHQ